MKSPCRRSEVPQHQRAERLRQRSAVAAETSENIKAVTPELQKGGEFVYASLEHLDLSGIS